MNWLIKGAPGAEQTFATRHKTEAFATESNKKNYAKKSVFVVSSPTKQAEMLRNQVDLSLNDAFN